jgi:hypothetical protein
MSRHQLVNQVPMFLGWSTILFSIEARRARQTLWSE